MKIRVLGKVVRFFLLALAFVIAPSSLFANSLYYDDGFSTDIESTIFTGYSCSGCHGSGASCTGTAVATGFLGYSTIAACIGNIRSKVSASPSYGVRMPQGCSGAGCVTSAHQALLLTWDSNGEPLSPPTVTILSAIVNSKTSATLRGSFDPNVWAGTSVPGTYRFNYGLNTSYGTTTSVSDITGTSAATQTKFISGLTCGTTYHFRGVVSNGAASVNGGNVSFSTSACTIPVITQGTSSSVIMSEDSNPSPFALTLNVTDNDPGTLTWSILTHAGNGTAGASGTGSPKAISYSPDPNYTGSDSFTVRVTNVSTGLVDDHVVNVTINAVDDPPVITQGVGPLAQTIDEDNSPAAFILTLNATDTDTAGSGLTWSISSQASNGTASASGTGLSKDILYTPNADYNGTDSFTVQVSDGASPDTITVNLTINARNDSPLIGAIATPTATENILLTLTPTVVDPDDVNDGSGINWSFQSGQQAGMTISTTGIIKWTPPQTGVFNQSYGPVVILAEDGREHGSVADTESFSILVSPPDGDSDGVADYNDLCVTVADATNADNDSDGTAGSDGAGANSGGDVCDADDDNDGMPDTFEIANGLAPFNAADASLDPDNDGVSNLNEFLNGTNPNVGDQSIDATGYWTPFALTPPNPNVINTAATAVIANDLGPYRPGHHVITWTASNALSSNLGTASQTLDIRPLVNFGADQLIAEGGSVTVTATINGDPVVYPVSITYSLSGSSNSSDHDASNGNINITSPNHSASFSVNASTDAQIEGDETAVFTIDSATNAVSGSNRIHTLTIVERNVAPKLELIFRQNAKTVGSAYVSAGVVDIIATISDPNPGQTHSLDWSGTDNNLSAASTSWSITAPTAGNYLIDLIVTDDGSPARSTHVSRILNIAATAPVLATVDSDNDGTNDDIEGLGDLDNDGIPDYLDPSKLGSELMPNQTVNATTAYLVETEPGLKINLGTTTLASNKFNLLVTDSQVKNFGSSIGGAPLNANDVIEHVGGVYDFEISGLMPGTSARIVIPLQTSIPNAAVYRKFDHATGWKSFTTNSQNSVASAIGKLGACPEPGSNEYRSGLNFLDNCIQLTIQDGGANDADNIANGVIKDPGAVGVKLNDPAGATVEGGGRMNALFLFCMLLLAGFSLLIRTGKNAR